MKTRRVADPGLARKVTYTAAFCYAASHLIAPETICVLLSAIQTAVAVEVLRLMPR
ncbi:MAG: hypothetical protein AAFQ16_07810 [Pseudomonadota bacterium]